MSRIAVLASGAGSNLQAILGYLAAAESGTTVSLVASDKPQAGALAIAARAGIPAVTLRDPGDGRFILALLAEHRIELVALAGYLRRVPEIVTQQYRGRMINVHPALLPAFGGPGMYGVHVHRAVLGAGVKVSGTTVHFVDENLDAGPIIVQAAVPIEDSDTPETLAVRILREEHRIYTEAIRLVLSGLWRIEGRRVLKGN